MKNNSKLNTILLLICVVLLAGVLLFLSGQKKIEQKGDLIPTPTEKVEKKTPASENEDSKKTPYQPTGAIGNNEEVIKKILSNYNNIDSLIANKFSFQVRGCNALPVKNGTIDYEFYINVTPDLADDTTHIYDTNGNKTGYCGYGSVSNKELCRNLDSKIDSCKVVYDTSVFYSR